jgi:hypothetical protein
MDFLKQFTAVSAIISAGFAVILTSVWMNGTDANESFLGGLNWNELIFNWHPILMVTGLIFCAGAIFVFNLFCFYYYI